MQHARGFIVGFTNQVTLISWEAEHTEQQIGQAFYRQKTILSAYYIRVTKWLVICLQSNPIGTNFAGFCSNLKQFYWYKRRGLLFKLRRLWAFYWVHIDWLAPGHRMGAGNPTISQETETQVPAACQPQPRQPHIIKLISELQKPTRRITDTWIIDTGKRETRYQLVKVHQTIQQPHSFCYTLTWVSHCCTRVPHPEPPSHHPPHPIPQGHPSAPALSALSHALNLDWRSISHMIIIRVSMLSTETYKCTQI